MAKKITRSTNKLTIYKIEFSMRTAVFGSDHVNRAPQNNVFFFTEQCVFDDENVKADMKETIRVLKILLKMK